MTTRGTSSHLTDKETIDLRARILAGDYAQVDLRGKRSYRWLRQAALALIFIFIVSLNVGIAGQAKAMQIFGGESIEARSAGNVISVHVGEEPVNPGVAVCPERGKPESEVGYRIAERPLPQGFVTFTFCWFGAVFLCCLEAFLILLGWHRSPQ